MDASHATPRGAAGQNLSGSKNEPTANREPRSLELEIRLARVILAPKAELHELVVSFDKQQETRLEAHAPAGA